MAIADNDFSLGGILLLLYVSLLSIMTGAGLEDTGVACPGAAQIAAIIIAHRGKR